MKKVVVSFITMIIALGAVIFGVHTFQTQTQNARSNHKTKQQVKHINLVALGDSLTEGVGDNNNLHGYSGRISKKINEQYKIPVSMSNFGKAGDRSYQIQQRLKNQSDFQEKIKQANVIVLTSGGNDLQQLLLENAFVKTRGQLTQAVKAGQTKYEKQLTALFQNIRQYNRNVPIFIFGNYNPLFVHFPNRTDLNSDVKLFNAVNYKLSQKDKNSYYVSTFDLTFGQYKTKSAQTTLSNQAQKQTSAKSQQQATTSALTGEMVTNNQWISSTDNYHPNNTGYNYMTNALFKVMRREQNQWLMKQ